MKETISNIKWFITFDMLPLPVRIIGAVMCIIMGYGVFQVRRFPALSPFGKLMSIFKIVVFYGVLLCALAFLLLTIFSLIKFLCYVIWVR